ncbi:LysR substrate-binding domain-containing protein [Nocardia sp. NPDC058114]|uniref:LysR substrate-binding domain-containing protein n=1 Tax=Nocardia sp. NPDC058114 TaxID=3346346 RepID=UPI0036D8413E
MIDPSRLQVLRAVELHGSVSEAARVMHLTPSAVSQQIKILATDIGSPLLERDGRTVRLTAAARTLLGFAHRVTTEWERTKAELSSSETELTGELGLCSFATAIPALAAPVAAALTADHPALTVTVAEADTTESLERLLHHSADVAIIVAPQNPARDDPRFQQTVLLNDPQDLIIPAGHHLAQKQPIPLEDFSRETWIEPHGDHRDLIEASCALRGFAPRFRHRADDWNAVLALVQAGMGVCLYPRMAPMNTTGVTRVALANPSTALRWVLACVRAGSENQPPVAHALRLLEQRSPHALHISSNQHES